MNVLTVFLKAILAVFLIAIVVIISLGRKATEIFHNDSTEQVLVSDQIVRTRVNGMRQTVEAVSHKVGDLGRQLTQTAQAQKNLATNISETLPILQQFTKLQSERIDNLEKRFETTTQETGARIANVEAKVDENKKAVEEANQNTSYITKGIATLSDEIRKDVEERLAAKAKPAPPIPTPNDSVVIRPTPLAASQNKHASHGPAVVSPQPPGSTVNRIGSASANGEWKFQEVNVGVESRRISTKRPDGWIKVDFAGEIEVINHVRVRQGIFSGQERAVPKTIVPGEPLPVFDDADEISIRPRSSNAVLWWRER